jgi:hypothetical protein
MKPSPLPEPERWSERAGGDDAPSVEDAIGASLRRVGAATEPSETATARWARQAIVPVARRPVVGVWSAALAATVLAGGGAVAGVAWHARIVRSTSGAPQGDPSAVAHARRPAPARRLALATPAPEQAALEPPAPLPPPAPEQVTLESPALKQAAPEQPASSRPAPERAAPKPAPAAAVARRSARTALAPATAPARAARAAAAEGDDESQLLARAFRHLRGDGDAGAALAALDERDRRFGAGPLGAEAALARAEALLLLGRTTEALPVLLAIRGERAGQTPTARAARAELLVRANRCGEAELDFEVLLAPGAPAGARERALYARASCRLRGGQPAAAVPDLESYLVDYPEGRFAPAVREALGKLRRP